MTTHDTILTEWKRNLPKIIAGRDPLELPADVYCKRCTMAFRLDTPPRGIEHSRCGECGDLIASTMSGGHPARVWKL